MLLVVDANVVYSSFKKSSYTRALLMKLRGKLIAPGYLLSEIINHKDEILQKFGISENTFELYLSILKTWITFVPLKEYEQHLQEAKRVCPDIKDVEYFALAIRYSCPIWSDDKSLKNQDTVVVISTKELSVLID